MRLCEGIFFTKLYTTVLGLHRRYGEIRNMWDLDLLHISGISWTEPAGHLVVVGVHKTSVLDDTDDGTGSAALAAKEVQELEADGDDDDDTAGYPRLV